jgi:hypothetical protein
MTTRATPGECVFQVIDTSPAGPNGETLATVEYHGGEGIQKGQWLSRRDSRKCTWQILESVRPSPGNLLLALRPRSPHQQLTPGDRLVPTIEKQSSE